MPCGRREALARLTLESGFLSTGYTGPLDPGWFGLPDGDMNIP
jgi:hypothetical protein